jgi:arachidonate 15-lipoxygenase
VFFELYLPQSDPDAAARASGLATARSTYTYSYAWPPEVAVAAAVPRSDTYSARYIAAMLPSAWDLFKNTLGMAELVADREPLRKLFESEAVRVPTLGAADTGSWFLRIANDISRFVTSKDPVSIESYGKLYASLTAPKAWESWRDDRTFCWQRLAGVNPMSLVRIAAVPPHVAISEVEFGRALPKDTLAAAAAEGRLFALDYSALAGAPPGTTNGRKKYLPAPYAVFAASGGALVPIAIQIGQEPGSFVATPADGEGWSVAKLAVQVADANYHETFVHLGRTHMVMEAVTLALFRQLSERHPLNHLLTPHCEYTLAINNSAATDLIAPGGAVDSAFAAPIEVSAALVKKALDGFRLLDSVPTVDLAARGVDDASILADFPYRDDALPVFRATRSFVAAYVANYYPTDAHVAGDVELAAFVDELGSAEGGRLQGIPRPETVPALVDLVSAIIWIGSAQHAAVNFTQYPYMGVVPNMVGAMWGTWPPTAPPDANTMLGLLPPYNMALLQVHTVFQLSAIRVNRLGDYPMGHFVAKADRAAASAFAAELAEVEAAIAARDQSRWISYPHLLPSNIPASIHI